MATPLQALRRPVISQRRAQSDPEVTALLLPTILSPGAGPSDRLTADKFITAVRAELKDRYPADRAVGFNDGDIRGWYGSRYRGSRAAVVGSAGI